MINDNITAILDKMKQLEQQLEDELETRQAELSYHLKNKRVRFERTIRKLHREYRVGLVEFFRTADLLHILTAPHNRLSRFADYGDAEQYRETLTRLREEFRTH